MAKAHAISIIANCDNAKHCQSSFFLAISSFSSISIFYDVDSLTIKFIWKAHYTCTDVVIVLQVSKSISLNSLTGLKRENSNALLDKVMSRNQCYYVSYKI